MPTAIADSPAPAARRPAPIAAVPTPISANAPASARIVGTRGVSTRPATPITVNAPAIVTSPLAMLSQLIEPRASSTGVRIASAPAATSMAAEPGKVPFITFRPMASSARAPPIVTSPFAISSQVIPPIFPRAFATISSAAPTAIRPTPTLIVFFGITFIAIATSANAPPIATSPLAI